MITNDLIHELYNKLGGNHVDINRYALVECVDGESTGDWVLTCHPNQGESFTVHGETYNQALKNAIEQVS